MTTATKKIKAQKTPNKRARKAKSYPPLPPTANVTEIAGQDFIIVSMEDYTDWYEDSELARIAVERLEREEHLAVPLEDILARQDRKRGK